MSGKERSYWKNWAGNQQCLPELIERPTSEQGLVRIVKQAAEAGQHVKVAGSGHSFTGVALTDGRLVQLDNYNRVLAIDREKLSATVQAGISIARLSEELDRNGLALENLGDINYQSISGAISTATHGTGRAFGGIATQVTGLRLITGDGSIIECSAEKEPEVFSAARVGLGALGIISTVTLRCVKAFNLRVLEMPERVDQVLERLDENIRDNDHFEFFWVPNTGWALTKRNERTTDARWNRAAAGTSSATISSSATSPSARSAGSAVCGRRWSRGSPARCRTQVARSTWTRATGSSQARAWSVSTKWSTPCRWRRESRRSTACAASSSRAA